MIGGRHCAYRFYLTLASKMRSKSPKQRRRPWLWLLPALIPLIAWEGLDAAVPDSEVWRSAWPRTDFSRHSVDFSQILSGGPARDGIPAIDDPRFVPAEDVPPTGAGGLGPREPVISLSLNGDMRAYPLRIMIWHEIVNDTVGGVPVAVTYCPLCNSAIVFERRWQGRVLDFGTTGKLRKSDLVMYDRQTESWWQQFLGEAIVGELTGARLEMLPSRIESFARFRSRAPRGRVLAPPRPDLRPYGRNPYAGYDSADRPRLYSGKLPDEIAPLARVVVVAGEAWSLDLLRRRGRITKGDLVLTWERGQNSVLDDPEIALGRDVGNVIVQKETERGLEDVVYDVSFAFAFRAFYPGAAIHVE